MAPSVTLAKLNDRQGALFSHTVHYNYPAVFVCLIAGRFSGEEGFDFLPTVCSVSRKVPVYRPFYYNTRSC